MDGHSKGMLKGITAFIAKTDLASPELVLEAQKYHEKTGQSPISYLIEKGAMDQDVFAEKASEAYNIQLIDVFSLPRDSFPTQYIKRSVVRKYQVLPISLKGNVLTIAGSDPLALEPTQHFRFSTGLEVNFVLAKDTDLKSLINQMLHKQSGEMLSYFDDDIEELNIEIINEQTKKEHDDEGQIDIDHAPIAKFINKIILEAVQQGASDIHFEPYEHTFRIRFRLDGVMLEIASPPNILASRITSRLKIMSNLDIAERRLPQDGRFRMQTPEDQSIDFRVSSCPTLFGEKIVLRILDSSIAKIGIDKLGYTPSQKLDFLSSLEKSQGLILITGPTGSGKTVSLYTGLNILNTPAMNISTAEDPVEINLPGINQVNINTKAGFDFPSALRSFLRQDPDIIMVGEVRDLETAEIAIKAAQTGHLVLSTLHTNSAPETVTRLMNMGIEPYNITGSVSLIIAQRLARKLCSYCKEAEKVPDATLLEFGLTEKQVQAKPIIYKNIGCGQCNRGYKGRVGIFEVMPISDDMRKVILNKGNAIDIAGQAQREEVDTLRQSALKKVIDGIISLEEASRVT